MLSKIQTLKVSQTAFWYGLILLFIYSPVFLMTYAYGDDYPILYSTLKFGHKLDITHELKAGRFIYGFFLWGASFFTNSVASLSFFRAISLLFVGTYGVFIYWFIKKREIFQSQIFSFLFPLLIITLPTFQVFITWEVCFPYILASLASGYAYYLSSSPFSSLKQRIIQLASSFLLLICAFSLFQPGAMSFLFFFLLDICVKNKKLDWKKWINPTLIFGISLGFSFGLAKILPILIQAEGRASLLSFSEIPYKVVWFILRPLSYSLQLHNIYLSFLGVLVGLALFILGLFQLPKLNNQDWYLRILLSLALLPASFLPNLVSNENAFSFRILIVLAPVVATISFLGILFLIKRIPSKIQFPLITLSLVLIAISAQYNIYWGMIRPAQGEYQAMTQVLKAIPADFKGRIEFNLDETKISYTHTYGEFNNTALLADWAIHPMAFVVLRDLGLPLSWIEPNSESSGEVYIIDVIEDLIKPVYPEYGQIKPFVLKVVLKSFLLKQSLPVN